MSHHSRPQTTNDLAAIKQSATGASRESQRQLPELYQVVIECRDEQQQRELFERLLREGLKLRLLVL